MGDVFSFFKQLLSYRPDSFAYTIKIINYKNRLAIECTVVYNISIAGRSVKDFLLGDKVFTVILYNDFPGIFIFHAFF
jgi:hypothetical protein